MTIRNLMVGTGVATAATLIAGMAVAQVPATGALSGGADAATRATGTPNDPRMIPRLGPGGAIPNPAPPGSGSFPGYRPQGMVNGVQTRIPQYEDVFATLDALPDSAPAKPKKTRKVLVYAHASGYAHSSVPITAFAIDELGKKTGAWTTTITYDQKDFTVGNLATYDVLVLDSTTGAFLDDRSDPAGTAARKAALLAYVRSGHGLVLTHATGDSYHSNGPAGPTGTWPEWNKMVGGFFKFHWIYPQEVTVKIDDPKSTINAGFGGKAFIIHDEIYTFAQDSFSRKNVHVLTSVDYSKMNDADKSQEPAATRRNDGDYALSWIHRDGKGRVFYEVLGHSEHIMAIPAILKQITAGIQYAAGDLAVDDSPSQK
jgi:type 1 glutamine amidotransferase